MTNYDELVALLYITSEFEEYVNYHCYIIGYITQLHHWL